MKPTLEIRGFPGGSAVENLPVIQELQKMVQPLGREDALEKGMTIHSSFVAWKSWTEEPGGLQSIGSQSRTRLKRLSMHVLWKL